jgi:hypothetical protein
MDFTRCVEDVELRRVRIEHDDALQALRRSAVLIIVKLRRVRANHSEAFEALQTRLTS